MNKQLTIKDVEVFREGVSAKTNKPWKLYKVRVNDAEVGEFTTFEGMYESIVGETVEVNLQKDEKYNNWKELTGKQAKEAEQKTNHEEIMSVLRKMATKLDEIYDSINQRPN